METNLLETIKKQVHDDYLWNLVNIKLKKYFTIMKISFYLCIIFFIVALIFSESSTLFKMSVSNISFLIASCTGSIGTFLFYYILYIRDKVNQKLEKNLNAIDHEKINELFIKKVKEVKDNAQNNFSNAKDSLSTYQKEIITCNIFLGSNT